MENFEVVYCVMQTEIGKMKGEGLYMKGEVFILLERCHI